MSSQTLARQIARVSFTPTTQLQAIEIPRKNDLRALAIRISGTYDITTNVTSVRAWFTEIIKRVQLVVAGQQNIFDAPFTDLVFGNFQRKFITNYTAPSAITVSAGNAFEATALVDLQNIDGLRSADSALHTHNLSLLQLIITTGQFSDMFVVGAGAGSVSTSATTITVTGHESLEDAEGLSEPRLVRQIRTQKQTVTAANTDMQIKLSRGNLLRAISVRSIVDGAPSETMVRNLKFQSGTDVRFNLPWKDTKHKNRLDYMRNSTDQNGIAIIDLDTEGRASRMFDLSKVTEADLVLDVVPEGTLSEVLATFYEFVPVPGA